MDLEMELLNCHLLINQVQLHIGILVIQKQQQLISIGYVTGINPGYAKITAYTANGYSDSCDVYVRYDGTKIVATANKFKGYTGRQMFNLFKQRTGNGFYEEWCALFVSYVYDLNNAVRSYKNLDQYAWSVSYFTELPNYKSKAKYPNYIPKKGDLIIFDNTEDKNYAYDHVGMVTSYNAKYKIIYAIEGNIRGGGEKYSTIVGYDQYYNSVPYRRVNGKQNMEIRGFLSLNNGL